MEFLDDEAALDKMDAMMEAVKPIFAGVPPQIQGAVLGNLVALWLGSHYLAGDDAMEYLLNRLIEQVRALQPIYIDQLRDRA
jgi:hypothetical protein